MITVPVKLTKGRLMTDRMNRHIPFLMIGDSHNVGGVALQSESTLGWNAAYGDVSPKSKILYRDDRTTDISTVRWLNFVQDGANCNRFPGYGAVPFLTTTFAGWDAPFLWYWRTNSQFPVALFKWAVGGSTLLSRAGVDNDWSPSNIDMFYYLINYYAKLFNRDGVRCGPYKAAFVSLGSNDVFTTVWNTSAFTAAIPAFCLALRTALSQPTLPIFWFPPRTDLNAYNPTDYPAANITACQTAINNCGSGGSAEIANFFVRQYQANGGTAPDGAHWSADLNEYVGLTFGAETVSLYNSLS